MGRTEEPDRSVVLHGAQETGLKAEGCWFLKPRAPDSWFHFLKLSFPPQCCVNCSNFTNCV